MCRYLARDLVQPLLTGKLQLVENVDYVLEANCPGNSLKGSIFFSFWKSLGMEYEHPFASLTDAYSQLKKQHPNVHTCVLSEEHVTTKEGTGIVHCAPGCGPEDYVCISIDFSMIFLRKLGTEINYLHLIW